MTGKNERRRENRVPIKIRVNYKCEDNFLIEYTTNLSPSGIFIKSSNPPKIGTKLELHFKPEDKSEEITAMGEVMWVNTPKDPNIETPGMGVKFTKINSDAKERIINLLKRVAILGKL